MSSIPILFNSVQAMSSLSFRIPTPLATINEVIPVSLPLLSPDERELTYRTNLKWKIFFLNAFHLLNGLGSDIIK